MHVTLAELEAITARLFQHLRDNAVADVDLPIDYYWSVPAESRYDPTKNPTDLTIGRLSDDWRELKRIQERDAQPLGYAFVWLSTILRAVGERTES